MTNFQMYVRILTELNYLHEGRTADMARIKLQDVLCELRDRAAIERVDPTGESTQSVAEHEALMAVLTPEQKIALEKNGSLQVGRTLIFNGGQ